MCWQIVALYLKIIWIRPLLFNLEYKLFFITGICFSKIQVIKKRVLNTDIYYLFTLGSSVYSHAVSSSNTKCADSGEMKFVEYMFQNS
jgi:hypothetical protein